MPRGCTRKALEPHGIIAEIEENGAAVFHVGVHLGKCGWGRHGGAIKHGPIDQREKHDFVVLDVHADGAARDDRCPVGQNKAKALQALLADAVHRVIASADIGQTGLLGGFLGIIIGRLRHGVVVGNDEQNEKWP